MKKARGVALLVVLWVMTLITVLLVGTATTARLELARARHQLDHAAARFAAEGGLAEAVFALRQPDMAHRWVPDGRPYALRINSAEVRVQLVDERGKIDINVADAATLSRLFVAAGANAAHAETLGDAVVDWRDTDDLTRTHGAEADAYAGAHLSYGPRNGPFVTLEQLEQVLGMDEGLYRRVLPALSVWSGVGLPNARYGSLLALQTLPGIDAAQAAALIAKRQQPLTEVNGQPPPTSGSPQDLLSPAFDDGGLTQSIHAEATLANGTRAVLDATVRLRGNIPGTPPYVVLDWREREGE